MKKWIRLFVCSQLFTAVATSASEIAAKRQLQPMQVSIWKRQAIEGMAEVFSDKIKKAENKGGDIKGLHVKIGQLAVKTYFYYQG